MKVFSHFKNFYINRVQSLGQTKRFSKFYEQNINQAGSPPKERKPYISEKSAQLAQNKRAKAVGENATFLDIITT